MANGLPPEKPLYTSKNTYPKSKIPKKIFAAPSDKFILTDLNDAEWILIMGQTGTGKTTLLNSMINYHWGVKFHDAYRYQVVFDETTDND